LWRVRDGVDPSSPGACHFQTVRCDYAAAHRQNGEDHFVDWLVRRLCLYDGIFRRVVQWQHLRAFRVLGPYLWSLLVVLVVRPAFLQCAFAATFLVPLVPLQRVGRFLRVHVCERRHVVRALHHYCRRLGPRFPAVVMESLSSDLGRYLDLHRHTRDFHFAVPYFHTFSADDRHV